MPAMEGVERKLRHPYVDTHSTDFALVSLLSPTHHQQLVIPPGMANLDE